MVQLHRPGTAASQFRRLCRRLLPAALLALLACAPALRAADDEPVTPEERTRGYRARTFLAKPRAALASVEQAEAREHVRLVRSHPRLGGLRTLEIPPDEDVKAVIDRLASTGLYEYVEPDYVRNVHAVPNDPRFAADQWSLGNTGQAGGTVGADIRATAAWDLLREAPDVIVAVIDTGVLLTHEDLAANLWQNDNERGGVVAVDDDNNGYIDDRYGINATVARTSTQASNPSDDVGHGSHVAGIIGAVGDNALGVSGVAWKVQIMPLKSLGRFGGAASYAVACIDYAIAKKAHIINASYGSTSYSQAEYDAIKRARDAGIIFVASAGNDSQEISTLPEYPAAYGLDNIVAVASTTRQDKLASYSTYGSGLVELAAPGSSILSLGNSSPTSYATLSGTSMAAPHVSGALALLRQRFPADSYRGLINRLLSSVDVLPDLDHRVHTNGRLNLLRALQSTDARPFNDDFARRAVLTGTTSVVRSSNHGATRETGEPDHGVPASGGTSWWSWTPPEGTGTVTITTTGSAIDTVLAVYRAPSDASFANLVRVGFNDDAGSAATSSVTFESTAGATYAIAVAGKGSADGLVLLNLLSVPVNDSFAEARVLSGPSVVVAGNNNNAGSQAGEPRVKNALGANAAVGKTLWYRWTAPETHAYQISTDGGSMDPVTGIFTGTAFGNLVQVAFDDDSGPGRDSLIRFNAIAGVTYHLCVDSFAASGTFKLSIADAAWQYAAEDEFFASPAIGPDGTIYAVDSYGVIHALTPDGVRRWRSGTTTLFVSNGAIAVGRDGTVYAADDFGALFALDPATGTKKWEFETDDAIWAAPAVAADGTIYVKSDDDMLYALNPDGTLKWKVEVPGDTYAAPAIGPDGTLYIGSGKNAALHALNPDGTLKWRAPLGATVYGSPAIGADGTVYIGNYDGRIFAFTPGGVERWHFDTRSPLSSSPVLDARGVLYVGSYDRNLYAIDAATGTKRWAYATGDIIRSTSAVLADDGTIYIGSDDCFVHALSPEGVLKRTFATTGPILAAPLVYAGRLFVASSDAKFYAFDTGNNLASSPWPMHRHNVRRMARAAALDGVPVIGTQPQAPLNVTAGNPVAIPSAATLEGSGTISYQWFFNNVAITGATNATLQIASAQGSSAGDYRVVARGPGGAVTSRSTTLAVAAASTDRARLVNLAVRTSLTAADRVLFVGFSLGGAGTSGSTPLLIRGVGPTLAAFGVNGAVTDPLARVFSGPTQLLENDDWAGEAQVVSVTPQVGAFVLASVASKDAAVVMNAAPGTYTAQISGTNPGTGSVLAEIYDATSSAALTAGTPRLVNVSARAQVGPGNLLIAGFAISGTSAKRILIRGIGPTLSSFNVPGVLANPKLELFASGETQPQVANDDWGAASNAPEVAALSASVGAFPLLLESRDAVLLVTLPPGSYTAQVSGVSNTSGAAIVEVYEVP